MMGCANQADTMTLYEYEERLWHWNEAHDIERSDAPPIDPDKQAKLIALANADPRLTGAQPAKA